MHAAACQFDISWESKSENFTAVRSLLREAGLPSNTLVCLPEMFGTGFSMKVDAIAEPAGGPTEAFLSELARELSVFLVGGVARRGDNGRARNEAVVFGPDGGECARYCKVHGFSPAKEPESFESGPGPLVFPWQGGKVGLFVCYDLRFPELFRAAVRQGAELLVVIANWPAVRQEHWTTLLRARSIENQAFVIGVNRVGRDPRVAYAGGSVIFGPRGERLGEAGAAAEVIGAEIEWEAVRGWRETFPVLRDRRLDL